MKKRYYKKESEIYSQKFETLKKLFFKPSRSLFEIKIYASDFKKVKSFRFVF